MAHNKLYRNFIILQEDEKGSAESNDKSLSGYAKVEAKGDKCKISFYAQNLKQEASYSMVLICCKKESKQLINLGSLTINEVGKGDTSKEYYINNIAGLGLSYEKIVGAAICKTNSGEFNFLMYGFMNGEEPKENWKKFKIIKEELDIDMIKSVPVKEEVKLKPKEEIKQKTVKVEKKLDDNIKIELKTNEVKVNDKLKIDMELDCKDECKDKCKDECKDKCKDKCKDECKDECKDKCKDKSKYEYKKEIKKEKKHEDKSEQCKKIIEDIKNGSDCLKQDNNKRIEENSRIDGADFQQYEKDIEKIKNTYEHNFNIQGKIGEYFEQIADGFEDYNQELDGIKHCKWYKIPVSGIDDLCNISNYNKYTLAYYPMLNYYPYINKNKHFLLGYKCDAAGELKYIVYAIPGSKDNSEQPYEGKTGFVTWTHNEMRNEGYWLMFYDFKNSTIVVPMQ